jgi:type I restriction enzyme S subunit
MMVFDDILEIKNGKNQKAVENPNGKYPIYGSGGAMGYADAYICEADTVIVGRKGSINNPIFVEEPFWNVDTAFGLQAKREVLLPRYLFYFCKFFDFERLNKAVTIPSLTKGDLLKIEIDLPELSRQQEIVNQLLKIEHIIELRKHELSELDNLIKARFVEMFGEPATNPMSWPIVSVGSMIESCEAGWSGKGQQREKKPGEIAVLKVSAITKGYFIPEECKVLDDQANIKKYVFPQKRDLLFSRANTREMVGATAVITEDFPELILPDKLWKIQFTEATNTWYMKYILSSKTIRDRVSAVSTGTSGSMYNISMEKLKAVQIPMPNFELQEQFAAFVAQVDKSKLLEQIRKITIRKEGITDDQL